ncbi:hypothetical protein NDU88_010823 [Pleurodeles waltl]|uniref:Uncharacterized protein n=1 Tax=Pleurodeles waltl TaxID=8319 RepID=A0AAV7Q017_PLEWA|nr:hypothetical protein NDU88_010823 [Pleurodeles waltl]
MAVLLSLFWAGAFPSDRFLISEISPMSDPSSPNPNRSLSTRFFRMRVGESLFLSWANSPRGSSRPHFFLGPPLHSDISGTPLVQARPISPGPQSGPSRSGDGPQPRCAGPLLTFYAVLAARVFWLRFTGSAPPRGPSTVRGAKRSRLCSQFNARPPLLPSQLHRKVRPLPQAPPGPPALSSLRSPWAGKDRSGPPHIHLSSGASSGSGPRESLALSGSPRASRPWSAR